MSKKKKKTRKIRTVPQLLKALGACANAREKYRYADRAFKTLFVNAHWSHAIWLTSKLWQRVPMRRRWSRLPQCYDLWSWDRDRGTRLVNTYELSRLLRKKANRIKYWPEVRQRLIELGVVFR